MLIILSFAGNFAGEKTKWSEEMNGLKQKLQEFSPVCAHAKIYPKDIEKDPTLKWVFEEILPSDYRMDWFIVTKICELILSSEFEFILISVSFFITGIFALKFKTEQK